MILGTNGTVATYPARRQGWQWVPLGASGMNNILGLAPTPAAYWAIPLAVARPRTKLMTKCTQALAGIHSWWTNAAEVVFLWSNYLKMFGIHTGGIAAKMVKLHSFCDGAMQKLPGETVGVEEIGVSFTVSTEENAVTKPVRATSPQPATFGLPDLRPKPVNGWLGLRAFHELSLPCGTAAWQRGGQWLTEF